MHVALPYASAAHGSGSCSSSAAGLGCCSRATSTHAPGLLHPERVQCKCKVVTVATLEDAAAAAAPDDDHDGYDCNNSDSDGNGNGNDCGGCAHWQLLKPPSFSLQTLCSVAQCTALHTCC
eukprot:10209-Pelagomonas_calceolata.AAC.3